MSSARKSDSIKPGTVSLVTVSTCAIRVFRTCLVRSEEYSEGVLLKEGVTEDVTMTTVHSNQGVLLRRSASDWLRSDDNQNISNTEGVTMTTAHSYHGNHGKYGVVTMVTNLTAHWVV